MNTAIPENHPPWLAECVRAGMALREVTPLAFTRITEHSNFNEVYRVDAGGSVFYVKVIPETPKRFQVKIPRTRIFAEVAALRLFRSLVGDNLVIPKVLFVDGERFVFGMTDVGQTRRVLLDVMDQNYALLAHQGVAIGRGLAAVHGGTIGWQSPRSAEEERIVRAVIFDGLLGPGAKVLFPEHWDEIKKDMNEHYQECLIHCDLWGKNFLVAQDAPVALVDFEGALLGDPAFDAATVLAMALIPALRQPDLIESFGAFAHQLLASYRETTDDATRAENICTRAYWYTGTFLAARGFGPFVYPMTDAARARLAGLARDLTRRPPRDFADFYGRVRTSSGCPTTSSA